MGRAERAAAVDEALSAIEHASAALAAGEDPRGEAAGIVHAAEDMLNAGQRGDGPGTTARGWGYGGCVSAGGAGSGLDQPTRWGSAATEMRSAAWRLIAVRSLVGRGSGDAGVAQLVLALAVLIAEIAAYHEQSRCVAQARGARASRGS